MCDSERRSLCELRSTYADHPHRKHLNRKVFYAHDKWGWSRFPTKYPYDARYEYGYPNDYDDNYTRYHLYCQLFGYPKVYYREYRGWKGEPPRFNLNLLRKAFQDSKNYRVIKHPLRFQMHRFKDGFV